MDQFDQAPVSKKTRIHRNETFTSATTYSDTGVSITIPGNSYVSLLVECIYANSAPLEVGIHDSTNNSSWARLAHTTDGCGATLCGYISDQTTLHIFARYGAAASNRLYLLGWYEPAN